MTYRPVDAATGWTQVWNGENRMVETFKGDDRLTFQYDYKGRRVEKKVYDGQALTAHLKFVYGGFKLVEELDALNADASLRCYTWQSPEVGLDVVLLMNDVPNAAYSFHHLHDANKNVMQTTDVTGNANATYSYEPFGKTFAIGGSVHFFGFSSEVFEQETGLSYYNYRYYWRNVGKWLSRDPVDEKDHANLYEFVHNSPINHVDRYGRETAVTPGGIHFGGYEMNDGKCYSQSCTTQNRKKLAKCLVVPALPGAIGLIGTVGGLFPHPFNLVIGGICTGWSIFLFYKCFPLFDVYKGCEVDMKFCCE